MSGATVTCCICHRVRAVEKMHGRHCIEKRACYSVMAARLRARPLTKRAERILKFGERA